MELAVEVVFPLDFENEGAFEEVGFWEKKDEQHFC